MNYHEKSVRSMSLSLPNRSTVLPEDCLITTESTNRNYTVFTGNIKNPPKLSISDDGSGTASNPKNIIINNRRRSESFAVYSGQEYFNSSPNESQGSFNELYFNAYNSDDSSIYFSTAEQHNNLFPHNLNVDKKIVLYKTEMCRTFEETGTCKYGTKCQFAHDPIEIRNIPRHPRYKTEICKTFWQLGNCPYGKRCCFIHTENELRDSKKTVALNNNQKQDIDIYGNVDLAISSEDVGLNEIQSENSSGSASPTKEAASKLAEDIKKSISNLGNNSIFNNLSISNLPKMSTITTSRRKSIFDDKIDELAILVGSNCTINPKETGPNSEDPEFKAAYNNEFELWSCDSPKLTDEQPPAPLNTSNKFALFDKSPGSRAIDAFANGIWSNGSLNTFIPDSQYYKTEESSQSHISAASSGTSSSKSHSNSNHQQLLIDMLNLLDSA